MKKGHLVICVLPVLTLLSLPLKAFAFCPLCIVATGAFTGLFRWLGVDDTIVGLWLGGFTLSSVVLINNFLKKWNKRIPLQLFVVALFSYLMVFFLLLWSKSFNAYNTILGINKIIFGIILGSILLIISPYLDKFLRKQNQGKIYLSHQKVLIAIGLLLIFSLSFYFITK